MEVGLVLILKILDAAAGGREHDVGFGKSHFAFVAGVGGIGGDDLAKEAADFSLQRARVRCRGGRGR